MSNYFLKDYYNQSCRPIDALILRPTRLFYFLFYFNYLFQKYTFLKKRFKKIIYNNIIQYNELTRNYCDF